MTITATDGYRVNLQNVIKLKIIITAIFLTEKKQLSILC